MPQQTILLVEDNPDDEALTVRALKKHNIANNIVVVRDGVEAVNFLFGTGQYAARNVAERPQIVLLDLKLPKMDGIEVLRRIRANPGTEMLPVVILTSSKEESDVIEGYRNGCNSYVRKPVNFDEFLEAARQLGLYWLLLNEGPPA
jgi:two-component system, response regulator